ncbi:hypothetical protein F5884DRAFT_837334 [Xylogone sp. PMI_703]|nr:hypothetical protein F5884DRAFT_837334 [Xylogone sp. PMI_703]
MNAVHRDVNFIGNEEEIRSYTLEWLPIISRKRFYDHLMVPSSERQVDTILLLYSMKLLLASPGQNFEPRNALYLATEHLYEEAETAGIFSLLALQARVLLAYYEMGHAVYPTAYLSVGYCASYGISLGIDRAQDIDYVSGLEFEEIEEKRRVWWAIVILDRYTQLGHHGHRLVTEEPKMTDYLPIDDAVWDKEIPRDYQAPTLSSPPTMESGRFARLSQGAYLLGRVFQNVFGTVADESFLEEEACQLRRTLLALLRLSHAESSARSVEFCAQKGICYSALFLLEEHRPVLHIEQSHIYPSYQEKPIGELSDHIRLALNEIMQVVENWLPQYQLHLPFVAPFSMDMLYQTGIFQIRIKAAGKTNRVRYDLQLLKEGLKALGERWKGASMLCLINKPL